MKRLKRCEWDFKFSLYFYKDLSLFFFLFFFPPTHTVYLVMLGMHLSKKLEEEFVKKNCDGSYRMCNFCLVWNQKRHFLLNTFVHTPILIPTSLLHFTAIKDTPFFVCSSCKYNNISWNIWWFLFSTRQTLNNIEYDLFLKGRCALVKKE